MIQSKTKIQDGANNTEHILSARVSAIRFFLFSGFVGIGIFCVLLAFCGLRVDNPPPLDTINPNTDPVASLVRLPGIGLSRAITIVEYRQSHSQNGPAFQKPEDLDAVSGLGPKTIEKMRPWLSMSDTEQSTVENK
jgi:competence ComEA-like helix-hairpin-helix protein